MAANDINTGINVGDAQVFHQVQPKALNYAIPMAIGAAKTKRAEQAAATNDKLMSHIKMAHNTEGMQSVDRETLYNLSNDVYNKIKDAYRNGTIDKEYYDIDRQIGGIEQFISLSKGGQKLLEKNYGLMNQKPATQEAFGTEHVDKLAQPYQAYSTIDELPNIIKAKSDLINNVNQNFSIEDRYLPEKGQKFIGDIAKTFVATHGQENTSYDPSTGIFTNIKSGQKLDTTPNIKAYYAGSRPIQRYYDNIAATVKDNSGNPIYKNGQEAAVALLRNDVDKSAVKKWGNGKATMYSSGGGSGEVIANTNFQYSLTGADFLKSKQGVKWEKDQLDNWNKEHPDNKKDSYIKVIGKENYDKLQGVNVPMMSFSHTDIPVNKRFNMFNEEGKEETGIRPIGIIKENGKFLVVGEKVITKLDNKGDEVFDRVEISHYPLKQNQATLGPEFANVDLGAQYNKLESNTKKSGGKITTQSKTATGTTTSNNSQPVSNNKNLKEITEKDIEDGYQFYKKTNPNIEKKDYISKFVTGKFKIKK